LDAEGAVWCTAGRPDKIVCFRVRVGGGRSDEFETERPAFTCMLGGEDGKTLFICEADWLGREAMDAVIAKRTDGAWTRAVRRAIRSSNQWRAWSAPGPKQPPTTRYTAGHQDGVFIAGRDFHSLDRARCARRPRPLRTSDGHFRSNDWSEANFWSS
jgi:hypothetical protein